MVSVTCPCVECIHNGRRNKCTAKNISLTFRNMATVNEGRVDMWICNKYEKSDFCKRFEENLKNNFGLESMIEMINDIEEKMFVSDTVSGLERGLHD